MGTYCDLTGRDLTDANGDTPDCVHLHSDVWDSLLPLANFLGFAVRHQQRGVTNNPGVVALGFVVDELRDRVDYLTEGHGGDLKTAGYGNLPGLLGVLTELVAPEAARVTPCGCGDVDADGYTQALVHVETGGVSCLECGGTITVA
mgnify:FL=1